MCYSVLPLYFYGVCYECNITAVVQINIGRTSTAKARRYRNKMNANGVWGMMR